MNVGTKGSWSEVLKKSVGNRSEEEFKSGPAHSLGLNS